MDIKIIIAVSVVFLMSIFLTYFITNRKANKKIAEYNSISEAIQESQKHLDNIKNQLKQAKQLFSKIDNETKELQALKEKAGSMALDLKNNTGKLTSTLLKLKSITDEIAGKESELHDLMAKLDLYSRVDEFVENGLFEMPEYLHETSARFTEEIKRIRQQQKELIKNKNAVIYPTSISISSNASHNKKILDGQVKLMLTSFNIECDALIGKVKPSSFSRTLERIEKLANNLEKSAATLHCGFNINYIKLKYEECRLQYQFTLKKQEEQDEQRMIREQIREEQKAIKEYERAVAQAEKEERMYRDMLDRAREELSKVSEEDRIITEQRIAELESQLAAAEAKEERAKSMAQQTRKGYVYIISNIGSFGDDIYKIGLTRRLEPMDRVKELGDASVPFSFDVHAMIYVEDAPALESALHREFTATRVNAVNMRKEFFKIDLPAIKEAVEKIAGIEAEFKMTALAEDYYETRRLQGIEASVA